MEDLGGSTLVDLQNANGEQLEQRGRQVFCHEYHLQEPLENPCVVQLNQISFSQLNYIIPRPLLTHSSN